MLQFICVRLSLLGLFYVVVYLCMCAFVVLDLIFPVLCREIGWEECLQNDLFCVEWDIKHSLTHYENGVDNIIQENTQVFSEYKRAAS